MSSSSPNANEVPRGLSARLSDISQERLVEEVISAWDEVNATERVIASLRQKISSLEMELSEREGYSTPANHPGTSTIFSHSRLG